MNAYAIYRTIKSNKKKNDSFDGIVLTYEDFLNFYSLNPNRWHLEPYNVTVIKTMNPYGIGNVYYHVKFKTAIDAARYRKFYSNKEERDRQIERNKKNAAFLNLMQEDINAARKRASEEIATAATISERLIKETIDQQINNALSRL